MGLDTVELVLRVEEEFGVEIPDEVAPTLETVGSLHRFVVAELERKSGAPVDFGATYFKLRDLISDQTGISGDAITAESRFVKDLRLD